MARFLHRMPTAFCRSLVGGAVGLRPVTASGKEEKAGVSRRGVYRNQVKAEVLWSARLPFSTTALKKGSSQLPRSSILPPWRILGLETAASPVRKLQKSAGSVMVTAAVEEVAAAFLDGSLSDSVDMEAFIDVGHKLADAAGEIIRRYFRTRFDIITKDDLSESEDLCDSEREQDNMQNGIC